METYDYIVVGGGSAGAAVAHRLSADSRNKVLLLEAGAASHPWSFIPVGSARLITNPAANWLFGIIADYIGRVRTLALSILIFSVFTALQGNTAENVAQRWQITREQQDEFAVRSQAKAEAA